MLYAALTLWLLVIIFSAWGVHRIWCGLVKPRIVNIALLPGTLVAQLAHVSGLLITGNRVRNATLMDEGEEGEPKSDAPEKQRIPIVGPIVVGLLPLAACAAGLYVAAHFLGGSVLSALPAEAAAAMPQALPTSLAGFWDFLRSTITLIETVLTAIVHSDLPSWPTLLFLYLVVCLTVRMAPFEGHRRGAIGAIILAAVVIGIIGLVTSRARAFILTQSWPILSFTVGVLLFLLLGSLLVAGIVGLVRILVREE